MADRLKVGIVGVNKSGGWAAEAHIPAVRATQGLSVAAVAARGQAAAEDAARSFGVEKAFPDGFALVTDPNIDIVTVATRVPDHRDLLLAAVRAGKHVYSEWPLGRNSTEAKMIAAAAREAGVKTAIGLQLRGSPAVRRACDIVSSGELGRLLSVNTFSSTAGFGPSVAPQFAYTEDPTSFANLVTIQAAHTLDLVLAIAGGLSSFVTQLSRQFPEIEVGEPPRHARRITFDHVLMQGRLVADLPFTLEVAGGRLRETPFWLDLVGDQGSLRLEGGAARGVQAGRLELIHNGERQIIAGSEELTAGAANVVGVYASLRDDILLNTSRTIGFDHAVQLTCLVEDVLASALGGLTHGPSSWPRKTNRGEEVHACVS